MVLHIFSYKCFAEGVDVPNYVHAFCSFVIRSAYVIPVLVSGPQKDISSHFITIHVTLKIISLLLNALGASPGIFAFTVP